MNTADFPRFSAIMASMGKLYERQLDAVLMDAYWMALKDWPLEAFEKAAAHLMGTSEFMPRPAAFTAFRKPMLQVSAGEAWAQVMDHCRHGIYRQGIGVDGGGPIDQAVRATGGYQAIAMHDLDKIHFLERRFAENFESAVDSAEAVQALGHSNYLLGVD